MKKAAIIITVISIIVSAITFFVIKKTDEIMDEISLVEEVNISIDATTKSIESSIDDYDDNNKYYYKSIALDQKQYVEVNECMQFYINGESFENGNNCEQKIVDAIIQKDGELSLIKSITGDMLNYTNTVVSLNVNYVRNLILSGERKTYLKQKLILAFVNRYRDPIKLQRAFTNNKAYFFNLISKDVYDNLYKQYINTFLNSYNEIHKNEDVEAFYKDIYFKAEKLNKQDEYWFYTFWKRRELEKNDHVIYTILNEINTHYTK